MIYVGSLVRLQVTFTNAAAAAADPTAISLKVQKPDGTETTYTYALAELMKSGTGIYYRDVTIDAAGAWYYKFAGTGAIVAAAEDSFAVEDSQF